MKCYFLKYLRVHWVHRYRWCSCYCPDTINSTLVYSSSPISSATFDLRPRRRSCRLRPEREIAGGSPTFPDSFTMSAVVLRKRNSSCFFEELNHHPAAGATTVPPSPSASKKARFASLPSCLSPPRSSPSSVPDSFLSSPLSDCMTGVNGDSGAGDSLTPLDHLRSLFPEIEAQVSHPLDVIFVISSTS